MRKVCILRFCCFAILAVTLGFVLASIYVVPKVKLSPFVSDSDNYIYICENTKTIIDDLVHIKKSVKNELVELETQRHTLLNSLRSLSHEIDSLNSRRKRLSFEIERTLITIAALKENQDEIEQRNSPVLNPPLAFNSVISHENITFFSFDSRFCTVSSCFSYRRCLIYDNFTYSTMTGNRPNSLIQFLKANRDVSPSTILENGLDGCVVFVDSSVLNKSSKVMLPQNSVIIHLTIQLSVTNASIMHISDLYRGYSEGIIASTIALAKFYRPYFDIVLPFLSPIISMDNLWLQMPLLLPARREHLLSYSACGLDFSLASVMFTLKQKTSTQDNIIVELKCNSTCSDGFLCGNRTNRLELLKKSTFCLILSEHFPPLFLLSSPSIQTRLFECLLSGAIPVLIGDIILPFAGLITIFNKAVLRIPTARVSELHFLLRTFDDNSLLQMRRFGRLIMERYIGTVDLQALSLLTSLRKELKVYGRTTKPLPASEVFIPFEVKDSDYTRVNTDESSEFLGMLQRPLDSVKLAANVGDNLMDPEFDVYPHDTYPYSPFTRTPLTESMHHGSSFGFRPIDHNRGGAGVEFSRSLGGNFPYEQFTIVMLTYQRSQVLMDTLSRLKDLPYAHSIIVIWNSPGNQIKQSLSWPRINIPIKVIPMKHNSLNNRFLPFDLIQTEAVLSLDDDVSLNLDEIVLGFRVWRENRERLVGYPARFHHWNTVTRSWSYNANHTCEYSMILTGAAFLHVYYFQLYSTWLPMASRAKVDELLNCEDILMNFLVAHVTRRPPLKVTLRWTFPCYNCNNALNKDSGHYTKRSLCINYFTRIFGYNSLLYSQYRADSVLFKTNVPADKAKCFRYV